MRITAAKLASFELFLLLLLIVSELVLQPQNVTAKVTVHVEFTPSTMNLENPPDWVIAVVTLPPEYEAERIDVTSALLEKSIPASKTEPWLTRTWNRVKSWFDGATVRDWIYSRLYHLGMLPPIHQYQQKLRYTVDWIQENRRVKLEGEGTISVTVPNP